MTILADYELHFMVRSVLTDSDAESNSIIAAETSRGWTLVETQPAGLNEENICIVFYKQVEK